MDIETVTIPELETAIAQVTATDEIEALRAFATKMTLTFSGNTGVPTLKGKILDALNATLEAKVEAADAEDTSSLPSETVANGQPNVPQIPTTPIPEKAPVLVSEDEEDEEIVVAPKLPVGPTVDELLLMNAQDEPDAKMRRLILRAQATKLVRVRITNLDPGDAEIPGQIVTVYNKYIGKVSKFIPFGDISEGGYHIPQVLVDHLKEQKFAMRREVKGPGSAFGVKKRKTTMVRKFNIEVLEPLTKEEVAAMASRQTASQAIDKE